MSNKNKSYQKFSYDEHARSCAPTDFLGQTRRTIQGKPVSDEQIDMIVDAIKSGLSFESEDVLLELACGNGALSRFLFDSCKGYLGVDISEHLVSVAKENFEILPDYEFLVGSGTGFLLQEPEPQRFTKVLCYAGIQYFSDENVVNILSALFENFSQVKSAFIGSVPDKEMADEFYKQNRPSAEELSDCNTALGVWRTKDEFKALAKKAGWAVMFSKMPDDFYASAYRYDVLLSRD